MQMTCGKTMYCKSLELIALLTLNYSMTLIQRLSSNTRSGGTTGSLRKLRVCSRGFTCRNSANESVSDALPDLLSPATLTDRRVGVLLPRSQVVVLSTQFQPWCQRLHDDIATKLASERIIFDRRLGRRRWCYETVCRLHLIADCAPFDFVQGAVTTKSMEGNLMKKDFL